MIIVADSSPLITLALIDKLEILELLFKEVIISEAVYEEISKKDKPKSVKLGEYFKNNVKIVNNKIAVNILKQDIDLGEAESIILALELKIEDILIDDLKGRKYAKIEGLKIIGSMGLLIEAKKRGFIQEIKPLIEILVKNDIRLGEALIEQVLKIANEK